MWPCSLKLVLGNGTRTRDVTGASPPAPGESWDPAVSFADGHVGPVMCVFLKKHVKYRGGHTRGPRHWRGRTPHLPLRPEVEASHEAALPRGLRGLSVVFFDLYLPCTCPSLGHRPRVKVSLFSSPHSSGFAPTNHFCNGHLFVPTKGSVFRVNGSVPEPKPGRVCSCPSRPLGPDGQSESDRILVSHSIFPCSSALGKVNFGSLRKS